MTIQQTIKYKSSFVLSRQTKFTPRQFTAWKRTKNTLLLMLTVTFVSPAFVCCWEDFPSIFLPICLVPTHTTRFNITQQLLTREGWKQTWIIMLSCLFHKHWCWQLPSVSVIDWGETICPFHLERLVNFANLTPSHGFLWHLAGWLLYWEFTTFGFVSQQKTRRQKGLLHLYVVPKVISARTDTHCFIIETCLSWNCCTRVFLVITFWVFFPLCLIGLPC